MATKVRSNYSYLKPFVTIIFSKDRPMQLDLALRSNEVFCTERNIRNEIVLYKASDDRFEKAYQQVAKEHPNTEFIKEQDFKNDILSVIHRQRYVLFMVDDCVVTHPYSLGRIETFLDICDGVLGFSLRLGENTKSCYPLRIQNDIPYMQQLGNNISAFSWRSVQEGDFAYPLEISSSVYRVKDIKPLIEGLGYSTPNSLEWMLSVNSAYFNHMQFLLCYNISRAFCNPINRVQKENNNRVGINPEYSLENLLRLYELGYRIDHKPFEGFVSNGCHQEADIDFISPDESKYDTREYR